MFFIWSEFCSEQRRTYSSIFLFLIDFKKIERLYKFYANEMDLTNEQMAKNAFVFFTRLKVGMLVLLISGNVS